MSYQYVNIVANASACLALSLENISKPLYRKIFRAFLQAHLVRVHDHVEVKLFLDAWSTCIAGRSFPSPGLPDFRPTPW